MAENVPVKPLIQASQLDRSSARRGCTQNKGVREIRGLKQSFREKQCPKQYEPSLASPPRGLLKTPRLEGLKWAAPARGLHIKDQDKQWHNKFWDRMHAACKLKLQTPRCHTRAILYKQRMLRRPLINVKRAASYEHSMG